MTETGLRANAADTAFPYLGTDRPVPDGIIQLKSSTAALQPRGLRCQTAQRATTGYNGQVGGQNFTLPLPAHGAWIAPLPKAGTLVQFLVLNFKLR